MSRKKRKFERNLTDVDKWLGNMKLKDLKRECVVRGLEFQKVIELSIPELSSWLRANFDTPTDHSLLDKFDDWQEVEIIEAMREKGEEPGYFVHPSLRLGYVGEKDDEGIIIKRKRVKTIIPRKKKKRERTEQGIFTGTKKAYTFQLQSEGYDKKDVIQMVKDKFPEAVDKSIGIWFNKAKKLKK